MIPTIDVSVALTKADLVEKEQYRGAVNATAMSLNGQQYDPYKLVFVGFRGSFEQTDGLFHGHYVFRDIQVSDEERDVHDLTVLPRLPSVLAAMEPEPDAVAESHAADMAEGDEQDDEPTETE